MKQYTLRKYINNTNESIATIEQIIVITSLAILVTSQLLK
jgi:Na+-transporting NADH:ubiquinone oxidoreductase subunit NqrD